MGGGVVQDVVLTKVFLHALLSYSRISKGLNPATFAVNQN